jgi:multidrug transporter EmrE-like cation transporter
MSSTPTLSVVFFLAASIFGAVGQLLYKTGAVVDGTWIERTILNARLLGGIACYVLVMFLFVAAYRRGGDMSVLYPIYATTFIVGSVLSYFVYGTPVKPVNVGGMALLVVGMSLMGR